MSRIRYQQIARELHRRIAEGEFLPGQVLPSEASLGTTHDASRVTIRRALEQLRAEGLVESRQGFGWTVAAPRLAQPLAGLTTIEQQLRAAGRSSERRVLDFRFVDAPERVAALLGPRVLEVRRLNLADGDPFARVTVWCREDLAADLSKAAVERSSFLELIGEEPEGASQTMGARLAGPADGRLLGVSASSAVLVVRRITRGRSGRPMLVSEHVFPGHLTEFVAELPATTDHEAASPAGVRLVDDELGG